MTEDKEIREAINTLAELDKFNTSSPWSLVDRAIQTLLALATRYLECEGMPEKIVDYDHNGVTFVESIGKYEQGYNQAIDDCRLALVKKCEGLEEVCVHWLNVHARLDTKVLATAIREHLEG